MFTGIITGLGRIIDVNSLGSDASHGKQLVLQAPTGYLDDVQLGDSIALNGACMTVTSFDVAAQRFTIDISAKLDNPPARRDRPRELEKACAPRRWAGRQRPCRRHRRSDLLAPVGNVGLRIKRQALAKSCLQAPSPQRRELTVNRVTDGAPLLFSINLIPHTTRTRTRHTQTGHA